MNTHKLITALTLVACSQFVLADDVRENLLGSAVVHGGFGGPEFQVTKLNGDASYMMGGKGAWLLNHTYYVGGAGHGSTMTTAKNGVDYDFGYGGLVVGCMGSPNKLLHYAADITFGGGGINERTYHHSSSVGRPDAVFVVEPKIYMAVNLAEHAQLNIGAGYRYVDQVAPPFSSGDLSSWVVSTNVVFGRF